MNSRNPECVVRCPAAPLRPFIAHYAGFRADGLTRGIETGVPSRHVHLIISLGRPIELVGMPSATQDPASFTALVSGLQDAPAKIQRRENVAIVHLFLTPFGAQAVLGVPSVHLTSRVFDLSDIWGNAAGILVERLRAAATWRARFAILDEMLLRSLVPHETSRELAWAWGQLAQAHGRRSVQGLAREIGWSRRHFTERFRASLGVTPKTAARIFRFERACRLIRDERPKLADLALACGYYDQAHLTREWNALAGCTPRAWIAGQLPFVQDYELAGAEDIPAEAQG
jgi:AraC-like DNA-binding protein